MKKILNWLFVAPKHEKPTDKNIMSLILPSILGIFVCMICLVGLTVAWYTVNIESKPQEITLANFHVETDVEDEDDEEVEVNNGKFTLTKANTAYTVTLSNKGTGNGYAAVKIGDTTYYTRIITGNDTLTFTVTVNAATGTKVEAEAEENETEQDVEENPTVKVSVEITTYWGTASYPASHSGVITGDDELTCDEKGKAYVG